LNPYPIHYRSAFAFSDIPYPLVHGHTLAGGCPHSLWERLGLPRSTRVPFLKDVRPRLPAGSASSARGKRTLPRPDCIPFGSCLSASLACCLSRRLSSGSLVLALSFNPSSRAPRGWQSQPLLTVWLPADQAEATVSRALRTPGLPPTHGSVGYRWQNTGSCSLINTRATSCRTSGKERALRPTPPLRTRRASFPAPGSSLEKAP
jgi:hypothetical protein